MTHAQVFANPECACSYFVELPTAFDLSNLFFAIDCPFPSPDPPFVAGRTGGGSTRKKGKIPTAYIAACLSALGFILFKILVGKTILLSTFALLLAAIQFFKNSGGHSGKYTSGATTIDGGKNIEITSAAKRRNADCAAVVTHYNQGDGLANLGTLGDHNLEMIGQMPLSAQMNYGDFNRRNVHQRADYDVFSFKDPSDLGSTAFGNQGVQELSSPDYGNQASLFGLGNQGSSKQFGPNDYYQQNDPFVQNRPFVISEGISPSAIVLNERVNRRQDTVESQDYVDRRDGTVEKEEYVEKDNRNTDRREVEEMDNYDKQDDKNKRKTPRNSHTSNFDGASVDHLKENYTVWKTLNKE